MKFIIDVSMVLERETKGAVRYQEVDAAGKAEPQKNIKVVISA